MPTPKEVQQKYTATLIRKMETARDLSGPNWREAAERHEKLEGKANKLADQLTMDEATEAINAAHTFIKSERGGHY